MNINRFVEIAEQISALLALPMPIPAEMHLLRAQIFALKYEQLGLAGDLPEPEQDRLARKFTLQSVPQRWVSYPLALGETCMQPRRDIEQAQREYAARPTTPPTPPEQIHQQLDSLKARWPRKQSPTE